MVRGEIQQRGQVMSEILNTYKDCFETDYSVYNVQSLMYQYLPETEITHNPFLFDVAQGKFYLSTERLSRSILHFKEGREGCLYSCTL